MAGVDLVPAATVAVARAWADAVEGVTIGRSSLHAFGQMWSCPGPRTGVGDVGPERTV